MSKYYKCDKCSQHCRLEIAVGVLKPEGCALSRPYEYDKWEEDTLHVGDIKALAEVIYVQNNQIGELQRTINEYIKKIE